MSKSSKAITPEVIEEIPLEEVIENTLVSHNVTDAVIASLKKKYDGLKLKDVNDKEGYLDIKEAKKEVRKWGILTEKLCKSGREDAIKIQRLWLNKEKEILGKISEIEDPLSDQMKLFEDEQERIENERKKIQEEQYMHRQSELLKLGAVYANGCFNLNDVVYEASIIREADEDVYQNSILVKYRIRYEKNNIEKAEEEKKKAEQEAELQKQKDEIEKQRLELQKQQEEFQRIKEEAEKIEREKKDLIVKRRCNQLQSLGMTFNFQHNAYVFEDVNVDNATEICLLEEGAWDEFLSKVSIAIYDRKEKLERIKKQNELTQFRLKLLSDIDVKLDDSMGDIGSMAEVDWNKFYGDCKSYAERKKQDEWAEAEKLKQKRAVEQLQEEQAKASDKEKWQLLLNEMKGINFPDFKSPTYKKKLAILKEKFEEINDL